jgi:hypothetical protein
VSVTTVGTGDTVFIVEVHAEANCRGFFTSIQMDKTWNLSSGKFVMDPVFKGPYLPHLAIGL